MSPECHGEWLLWRAAEGLPYPDTHTLSHRSARDSLEEDDAETDAEPHEDDDK